MIKIAPSILSADFAALGRDIDTISDADYIHFDVMDGVFVPNISFGLPVLQSVRKYTDKTLDVHLMIDTPSKYVERFIDAGADIVMLHLEADSGDNIKKSIELINARGKKAGLALKPKTPAEAVLPYIKDIHMALCMTVEPGFGGQKFMADMMEKVQTVRAIADERNPALDIEVDGGINRQTAEIAIESGANVLVAGSSVFKADNRNGEIKALRCGK